MIACELPGGAVVGVGVVPLVNPPLIPPCSFVIFKRFSFLVISLFCSGVKILFQNCCFAEEGDGVFDW